MKLKSGAPGIPADRSSSAAAMIQHASRGSHWPIAKAKVLACSSRKRYSVEVIARSMFSAPVAFADAPGFFVSEGADDSLRFAKPLFSPMLSMAEK